MQILTVGSCELPGYTIAIFFFKLIFFKILYVNTSSSSTTGRLILLIFFWRCFIYWSFFLSVLKRRSLWPQIDNLLCACCFNGRWFMLWSLVVVHASKCLLFHRWWFLLRPAVVVWTLKCLLFHGRWFALWSPVVFSVPPLMIFVTTCRGFTDSIDDLHHNLMFFATYYFGVLRPYRRGCRDIPVSAVL